MILALLVATGAMIWWWLMEPRVSSRAVMQELLLKGLLLWALLFGMALITWQIVLRGIRKLVYGSRWSPLSPSKKPDTPDHQSQLTQYLQTQYGLFWRYKVRLLLVVGEPAEIEAVAPTLAAQKWLEGQGTVLLWGGSALLAAESFQRNWAGLSRWRALDGVVWALTAAQYADDGATTSG
ncbi:hypothetical protein BOH73_23055, partial [Pseudomonas versuta]